MNVEIVNPSLLLESAEEMEFLDLPRFDSGGTGAFRSSATDKSPWEMHPECDELLHIIEGKVEIEILPKESGVGSIYVLTQGTFMVVPRGCWHRQTIMEKTKEYYVTPGPTIHSHSDDPRIELEGI